MRVTGFFARDWAAFSGDGLVDNVQIGRVSSTRYGVERGRLIPFML